MTLDAWLSWLEQQHPKAIDLGLERAGQVADRLSLRVLGSTVITVGGTNGKGSTVAALVSMSRAAGLRVGSYTSPHILNFNERICLNGVSVDDATLVAAFEKIRAAQGDVSLTYFEFTTLAAFLIFREAKLDVVVLEVGLGGRLDAVNLVDADVAVVTSIGIDHTEYLGDTRELIAIEKAGIFRAGKPVICGDSHPPETLRAAAAKVGAQWVCRGQAFDFRLEQDGSWTWHDAHRELSGLPRPQLALANAATAVAALLASPLLVSEQAIREGLHHAVLAGRMQVAATRPLILLDVAHNPHGAQFFMEQLALARPGQRTWAVLGMLADKDVDGVIAACLGKVDGWFAASLQVPRGAAKERLTTALHQQGCQAVGEYDSVALALAAARQLAAPTDRIIVFGSFYTVAAAQQALNNEYATS